MPFNAQLTVNNSSNQNKKGNNNPFNKTNKPNSPKGNKFNPIWIYVLIGGLFLAFSFLPNSKPKDISQQKFYELVQEGKVKEIKVYNRKRAEIYLSPEAKKELDSKGKNKNIFSVPGGANYVIEDIGYDWKDFSDKVQELQKDIPEKNRVVLTPKKEQTDFWYHIQLADFYWNLWIFLVFPFETDGWPKWRRRWANFQYWKV